MFAFTLGTSLISFYLFVAVPILSAVSFTLYGIDKWKAKSSTERIPEASLLMIDAFGGWPGGLTGQKFFRHKTVKVSYQIKYWLTVVFNLICIYVVYRAFHG
ncbi:DUF1294 domain-containing protein [Pirellulaceae bacterium]|nr:DUF1294 domain-containing protein [Pirellulaceae bacterium]